MRYTQKMREQILIVIGLLPGISLLSALSDRLRIPTPVLLVVAGLFPPCFLKAFAKRKLLQEESGTFLLRYHQLLLELVQIRRRELNFIRHNKEFDTESILEVQRDLDLEEARLHREKSKDTKISPM